MGKYQGIGKCLLTVFQALLYLFYGIGSLRDLVFQFDRSRKFVLVFAAFFGKISTWALSPVPHGRLPLPLAGVCRSLVCMLNILPCWFFQQGHDISYARQQYNGRHQKFKAFLGALGQSSVPEGKGLLLMPMIGPQTSCAALPFCLTSTYEHRSSGCSKVTCEAPRALAAFITIGNFCIRIVLSESTGLKKHKY